MYGTNNIVRFKRCDKDYDRNLEKEDCQKCAVNGSHNT